MSKENVANGELSEEQRARISQKFRAAKALLSRKRPHDSANFSNPLCLYPSNGDVETPARLTSIKRVPLSELNMNTPSPFSMKTDYKCENRLSCHAGVSVIRTMDAPTESETPARLASIKRVPLSESNMTTPSLFSAKCENRSSCLEGESVNWTMGVRTEDGFFGLDSFKTPMRQPQEYSSVNDSLTSRNILGDNEFDDSIFEEIDALCVQKSVESSASEKCRNGNLDVRSQFDDTSKGEHKTNMEPNAVEESLNAECTLDVKDDTQSRADQMENSSMPEEYSKYLKSLNDRQREAACCDISIPLMIAAGPGSGKTSTMVGRILMLLNEGIGPTNILAMTFTTAAASEMRERIGSVAGKAIAKELIISTFHSFSLQLCRSHADKLERTAEFLIFGHGQQRRAIIEAVRIFENEKSIHNHDLEKHGEDSTGNNFPQQFKDKSKKWQKFVTQAKACGKTPAECRKEGDDIGAMILGNYNDTLRTCNALDYHDLISCSVKLLTDFPEVFEECQKSWKAIVIDEFQDTSAMQYSLLRLLASHNCITIVGDDDQSIFSFNGADNSGFDSFRKDFPNHKEVRLNKNYRSTRCIVEAASFVIQNNINRCQLESALTDNCSGSKITVKECQNEDAQCAFVVDKILEIASDGSADKCSFGNIAILYRRQVSGKVFQTVFRGRRIPFNMHGVALYRKKVVKAIMAMLRTTLPGCDDGPYRQAFKALLPFDKEGRKRVTDHIDKISTIRKCSFLLAACDIFAAKISGTFKRSELTQGRKVLATLEMISKLARREQSISAVLTSVANMLPQKYLLEKQAVVDVDGGKLLNEDNDLRSVLQYLLDDVSEFLSTQFNVTEEKRDVPEKEGCLNIVKAFVDYTTERETENFRSRRLENRDSVTLTTIHQSKGLEWDTVFIAKANESEIPLLHEFNGIARQNAASIEEERRLFYVAMTRARKKLFILYVTVDSNWQMLQPSRFLKEIPGHLRETQADLCIKDLTATLQFIPKDIVQFGTSPIGGDEFCKVDVAGDNSLYVQLDESLKESIDSLQACNGNSFLKRFRVEDRGVVSHLFHQWARKKAFQDPKRLIDKVGFVIDERLTVKKNKHKDVLRALKTCLRCEEAFLFAQYAFAIATIIKFMVHANFHLVSWTTQTMVLRWEQIPADKRAHLVREKQEHFQKLRIENAMGSSAPTTKQIAFLQSLGCTMAPTSRLHASHLIEQYKSL